MRCSRCYISAKVILLGSSLLFLLAACGPNTSIGGGDTSDPPATPKPRTPLTLDFRCNDSGAGGFYFLNRGTHARVCVQTAPGAALTIIVRFCNGAPDPSSELKGTVYADSKGYYEWNWKPQPDCKGGYVWRGEAIVKAQLHGQSTSLSTSFFGD